MNAYVNHGRWVVECGTRYCSEAFLATYEPVICNNCGQPTTVEFPDDRDLIDAALGRRIVPETRNWVPGETVTDLVAENDEHISEGVVV